MSEKWLFLPGYDNLYMVSSLGRVKSFKRIPQNAFGTGGQIIKGVNCNGYLHVRLPNLKGGSRLEPIHYLVAEFFGIEHPPGYVLCHIDGNTHNNAVSNLEFRSRSDVQKKKRKSKPQPLQVVSQENSEKRITSEFPTFEEIAAIVIEELEYHREIVMFHTTRGKSLRATFEAAMDKSRKLSQENYKIFSEVMRERHPDVETWEFVNKIYVED